MPPTSDTHAWDLGEAEFPDLNHQELALLLRLGQQLVAELDVDVVLSLVAETACEVVRAETLVVPMIDPVPRTFTYGAASGVYADLLRGRSFPIEEGACGWVLKHRRPLLFGEGGAYDMNAAARWEPGMASSLLVPLICRGRIIGGLSAMGRRDGRAFNRRDLAVLTLFASQASIAIDNARLFRALGEEESRLRLVLDSASEAIYGIDTAGRCTFANPACLHLLGYPQESGLIGCDIHATVHHHHANGSAFPADHCPVHRSILEGQVFHVAEDLLWRRDGTPFPVEYWAHPIIQGGQILGGVVTFVDITERKRAAGELEQYRHHLEELVTLRTEELAAAKEVAEAANRAKSVFLSNMSHELRTPLNAILGFSQIMERDPRLPEELHRNLHTINQSGQHLLALINDVLEISRIEAGRIQLQDAPFDLEAILTAVEEMIRVRAEARGLVLRVERHGPLPPCCLGDAHHLRQVLINLLGNAVKYTDQGRIGLHLYPEAEGIRFEVTDTGPGIAPEEQGRVFDAFYQTEAGKAKGEGTGLGLAISRELVRLMGGELRLESAIGRGSCFHFTIPLPATELPDVTAPHGRVVCLEPGQPRCRVLVAEDHPDNRALIVQLLGEVGFEVRTVENGQQALEAFQSWQPHFIWMDMRMPVMDGYEAARRIRALPGGREVRIAALTASAFREDRDAILAAGCDEMVRKPIEVDRLFAVMAELLGLRYRYEAPAQVTGPRVDCDLHRVQAELRGRLAQAAEELDEEACRAIAEWLRVDHPDEAEVITGLIDGYRFDRVLELCEGA